ncbi:MAG TPA: TRAP transporter small permease subunit [Amaricoccus sp.]|uniref:TRAP transporter small permease n=1 Tax=Amaricoccus sp. TaxID=1872485 RepID=UPI002C29AEBE|nr:TRAP transporter small permease subunit [Amaricoccus sp.]HMQ92158.1 TRAP transporter small permease subunit [Amaricoccus sp.]HMR53436.1 TRAP transporter small permease subunit [Amaricoccus sp.]HMU00437.1 TRAP transporter small permease subunit [Amaricoccus sp.]
MGLFKILDSILMRIMRPVVVVIGLAVAFMLAAGIFSRSVLGTPVFGLEEIMLLAIMWFYMLGASLASRERSHLTADFVKIFSSNPKVWRAAAIVATAISLVVAVMMVVWSWDFFAFGVERNQKTPVFGIPWWVSQSSLLFASVLFVAYLVRDLIQEIRGDASITSGDPLAEVE